MNGPPNKVVSMRSSIPLGSLYRGLPLVFTASVPAVAAQSLPNRVGNPNDYRVGLRHLVVHATTI